MRRNYRSRSWRPLPSSRKSFRPPSDNWRSHVAVHPAVLAFQQRIHIPIRVPRDSVVRDVAREAGRKRRTSKFISNFNRAIQVYCGILMGYMRRTTVSDYVYEKLRSYVYSARQGRRPLRRCDIELVSEELFRDIERRICDMATRGSRLDRSSSRGYVYLKALIPGRKNYCFLTLSRCDFLGVRRILCLQTGGMYNRRKRRPSLESGPGYKNTPHQRKRRLR
ncbi:MAG: hypothetical protein NUV81_04375 [bacterium]|nr:hypothetical protein [bacterium]